MFVKVCGITRLDDARQALESGASALGFVLWPKSPRYVAPEEVRAIVDNLPAGTMTVGVFVDETADQINRIVAASGISTVQLNDESDPAAMVALDRPVLKVVTLANVERLAPRWPADVTLLLDAHDPVRRGGTGMTVDWVRAAAIARSRRLILAGGLGPANVAEAIERVRPYGVDVSSGVESSPGVKDPWKVADFVSQARAAFEGEGHGDH
jgi:phosphoribosylanthranilate isomerase